MRNDTPATRVVAQAARLIYGDRQEQYGDSEEFFATLGKVWGARLGIEPIPAFKVKLLMQDLKTHRMFRGKIKEDNAVDNLGYGMLAVDSYLRSNND